MRRLASSASSSDSAISEPWPVSSACLTITRWQRSGPSIRPYAGWLAQDTSEHDSWICRQPSRAASPSLLGGPPRYEEQPPPLVACSDVIGSGVTDILMLAYRGLTMDRFLMGGTSGRKSP